MESVLCMALPGLGGLGPDALSFLCQNVWASPGLPCRVVVKVKWGLYGNADY